ncbi:MAG TPA: hypothetical protein VGL05_34570, partial [Kribbella sp.]
MPTSLPVLRLSRLTVLRLPSSLPVLRLSGLTVLRLPGLTGLRLSRHPVLRLPTSLPVLRLPAGLAVLGWFRRSAVGRERPCRIVRSVLRPLRPGSVPGFGR